jgi:hypothetical protein
LVLGSSSFPAIIPQHRPWPWRCSRSLAVLPLLGIGLGTAPNYQWHQPCPWWCSWSSLVLLLASLALLWCSSSAPPYLCPGATHKTFGLALVLLLLSIPWPCLGAPPWFLGLALVLLLGSLVLCTKASPLLWPQFSHPASFCFVLFATHSLKLTQLLPPCPIRLNATFLYCFFQSFLIILSLLSLLSFHSLSFHLITAGYNAK